MRYIGARYVPIFYTNSDDGSIDWQMNVNYEPLVYVKDQNNHLYLSKKYVPDTVGHPADNISYWLDVTTFIGSTQDLQDQINTINGDLTSLDSYVKTPGKMKGRRIIILTDSYGQTPVGNTFYNKLLALHSDCLIDQDNIYCFAYGGRGFVGDTTSLGTNATWEAAFFTSGDYATVSDPDTITEFIILGGANDINVAESDLNNNAEALLALIKTHFPNAIATVGFWGFSKNLQGDSKYREYIGYYANLCYRGYTVISNANTWLHYSGALSDNVHPNNSGANYLAGSLGAYILGHNDVINIQKKSLNSVTPSTMFSTASTFNAAKVYTYIDGQETGVISEQSIYIDAGSSGHFYITANYGRNPIGTLDMNNLYTFGALDMSGICTAIAQITYWEGGSLANVSLPVEINYNDGTLYFLIMADTPVAQWDIRAITIGKFRMPLRADML